MSRVSTARSGASFLALACVGFIATAPAAHAADGNGPVPADADKDGQDRSAEDREQIVVTGGRAELQGPKATASVQNTPRSVVILPKDVIDQTGSTTLADALRTVPGITFGAAEGGNPIGDRPFIRGFDSQGSTFVDGVRDTAAQTRDTFAIEQVQVIRGSDSTLGGRGSAGGSINIITKVPQQTSFIRATGSVGTADYKHATLDVNQYLGGSVGVRVAAMWHDQDVAGRDAIWQRRWGVAPSVTIGLGTPTRLTASYYYLESHELPDSGIPYLYTLANAPGTGEIYSEPAIGNVRTIAGVTGRVDRDTFYGLKSRDFRDTFTHQATVRVEHDFGTVTLRNTSRYNYNEQNYIYTQPDDQQGNVYGTNAAAPATAGGLVWRRANTRYGYAESLTNQTDLFGTFETGAIKHSVATGFEISWEKARRGAYVLATGSGISPRCTPAAIGRFYCTSLFSPNPSDPWVNYTGDATNVTTPIVKGAPTAETQNDAHTLSAYAFDSITLLPSLILNLGARVDRFTSKITPALAAGATQTTPLERTDTLFNWQAGLVFKPTANTSLYASYATAATPPNSLLGEGQEPNALPTTNTAANLALLDSLKVEKTKSYEVGAKAGLFDNQLSLTLAAFQTDTDNARATGPDNTVQFIGKRRIRGVEFSFNGNLTKWLNVFGGYTHLDPKIVDGGYTVLTAAAVTVGGVVVQQAKTMLVPSVNTGRQATQTARDSFTLWANATPIKGLSIGGGAYYMSRVFGGYSDNRSFTQNAAGVTTYTPATKVRIVTVPEYWRFDARIGYTINEHFDVSVNVQNLTDKVYFPQAYTAHYASIAPGRSAFATLGGEVLSEDLDSLSADEIAARLSGSPEVRAALVRAGAEQGVAEAQAVLGQMLLDAGDPRAGFAWFNKAAAQGHLMALNMVGRCYDLGWGTPVDKARAAECFRVAAARGLDWGMYNYATALALGAGVAEDKAAALAWFEKAAAMGNAKAINYVGSFHEDGWVVARDMARAADLYRQAAEGGDFRGAFNHARMLLDAGRVAEARTWLVRTREGATPAFAQKARDWLKASRRPELEELLC